MLDRLVALCVESMEEPIELMTKTRKKKGLSTFQSHL